MIRITPMILEFCPDLGVLTNRAQDGEEVQPIKRTRRPSTHYATQEWTT
jgi:hypothetical protein